MKVPRLHREVSIFDPDNTIDGGIEDARGKAENYITDITEGGIMVHPSDDATSGWRISSAIELLKSGVRYIKAWMDGATPTVRLGQDSAGHTDVTPSGLDVYSGPETRVAKFGCSGSVEVIENMKSYTLAPETGYGFAWQTATAPDITKFKAYVMGQGGLYEELPYGAGSGAEVYYTTRRSGNTVSANIVNNSKESVTVYAGIGETSAALGDPEAYIGDPEQAHAYIDYRGMKMVDKNGGAFMSACDLRGPDGKAEVTETFAFSSGGKYVLAFLASSITSVEVDGSSAQYTSSQFAYTVGELSYSTTRVNVTNPASGSTVTVTYKTASDAAKVFSFGNGITGNVGGCGATFGIGSKAVGLASVSEGVCTEASGWGAHAEGIDAKASGWGSHAGGLGTVAASESQTAIGTYNAVDAGNQYALIVGNGIDDTDRTNAFAVTWGGNAVVSGQLLQSSDARLKDHVSYLGDDAVRFVRSLKPALYEKGGGHVGFYAQDVREADPWGALVSEGPDGFLSLDYQGVIAPLVAYCQHLEERISALEGR